MPINYAQALDELADEISTISEYKGFWDIDSFDDFSAIPLKLALVHSEITEALDVHRQSYDDSEEDGITRLTSMQEDDFTEELADAIIRILDIAGVYDLDIGNALVNKIETNRGRPHRHGKRY